MSFSRVAFFGFLGMGCALACSSDDTDITPDAATDQTVVDAPKESAPNEAATEASTEASTDAAPDASPDATEDATLDAVLDVTPLPDASKDAPIDVGFDVNFDAGGCLTNSDCAQTDYCERGDGFCVGAGTCTARPQNCFQLVKPVCGCNNSSYINSCYAHQAGQTIAYNGDCE